MYGVLSPGQMTQSSLQGGRLTDEQGQKLTDVLSQYDSKNLTNDDAKSLVAQIKEIGISSKSGLAQALDASGIDPRKLMAQAGQAGQGGTDGPPSGGPPGGGGPGGMGGMGGMGGAGGPPPGGGAGAGGPPPGGGAGAPGSQGLSSVDAGIVSLVSEAAQSFLESDDAESVWSILEPKLQSAGYDTSKSIIDFYA